MIIECTQKLSRAFSVARGAINSFTLAVSLCFGLHCFNAEAAPWKSLNLDAIENMKRYSAIKIKEGGGCAFRSLFIYFSEKHNDMLAHFGIDGETDFNDIIRAKKDMPESFYIELLAKTYPESIFNANYLLRKKVITIDQFNKLADCVSSKIFETNNLNTIKYQRGLFFRLLANAKHYDDGINFMSIAMFGDSVLRDLKVKVDTADVMEVLGVSLHNIVSSNELVAKLWPIAKLLNDSVGAGKKSMSNDFVELIESAKDLVEKVRKLSVEKFESFSSGIVFDRSSSILKNVKGYVAPEFTEVDSMYYADYRHFRWLSPINLAALFGSKNAFKALFEIDNSMLQDKNMTFMLACIGGNKSLVKFIIDNVGDVKIDEYDACACIGDVSILELIDDSNCIVHYDVNPKNIFLQDVKASKRRYEGNTRNNLPEIYSCFALNKLMKFNLSGIRPVKKAKDLEILRTFINDTISEDRQFQLLAFMFGMLNNNRLAVWPDEKDFEHAVLKLLIKEGQGQDFCDAFNKTANAIKLADESLSKNDLLSLIKNADFQEILEDKTGKNLLQRLRENRGADKSCFDAILNRFPELNK